MFYSSFFYLVHAVTVSFLQIYNIPDTSERLGEMFAGVDVTAKSIIDVPRTDGIRKFQRAEVRMLLDVRLLCVQCPYIAFH